MLLPCVVNKAYKKRHFFLSEQVYFHFIAQTVTPYYLSIWPNAYNTPDVG